MGIFHYITHLFGWNSGKVITKLDKEGNVWVAFQCSKCGKIEGAHRLHLK